MYRRATRRWIQALGLVTLTLVDVGLAAGTAAGTPEVDLQAEELNLVTTLVREFPQQASVYALLGNVLKRRGQTEAAVRAWRQAVTLDPRRTDALVGIGRVALTEGDYAEALTVWDRAHGLDPQYAGLNRYRAQALLGLGRTPEAIAALRAELAAHPGDTLARFLLGQTLLQEGDLEGARDAYDAVVRRDPNYTNAYYGLARVYARLGDGERAAGARARFKTLKAREMEALRARDTAYDDQEAIRDGLVESLIAAAQLQQALRRPAEAEASLRRALALQPRHAGVQRGLAELFLRTGRPQAALPLYETLVQQDAHQPAVWLNLGALYANLGRGPEAEAAFRRVIAVSPQHAAGYRSLAQLLLRENRDLPEALVMARRAVDLGPEAESYFVLSWAWGRNGNGVEARAAIQEAIRRDPGNARYRQILSQLSSSGGTP